MAEKHIADGESSFKVACTAPDSCQVGQSVVPFDSSQTLDQKKSYDAFTKARGEKILTVGSVVKGSQSNAGAGVVSGTSQGSGDCIILSGAPHVKSCGQPIARHLSDVAMNNGNTAGKLYTQQSPANGPIQNNRSPCNNPPKSSEQLERLKALKAKLADNAFNANHLDQYVRFDETSQTLDGAIGSIRPEAGSSDLLTGTAGVARGVLGFLKDGVLGIGHLAYSVAKRASPVTAMEDQVDQAILAENIRLGNVCLEMLEQQAKAMGKQLAKPVTDAWARGDYAEAVTRGGVELATILLPIAKAGLAGKAGEAASTAGKMGEAGEAASTAGKAGEASKAGEAASAAEKTGEGSKATTSKAAEETSPADRMSKEAQKQNAEKAAKKKEKGKTKENPQKDPQGEQETGGVKVQARHSRKSEYPHGNKKTVRDKVIKKHTDKNGDIIDPETGDVIPKDQVTIEHKKPVVEHWNEKGYNQTKQERNDWYNNSNNLTVKSKSNNSSEGARLGQTYRQTTGPNYQK